MNAVFISDLHLSEERPLVTAAFFAFLAGTARQCESLYILGDLFDAWIGDDDDRPLVADVAVALRALSQLAGVSIFFQHGNRDFLLGEAYASRCGMSLLPELHCMESNGDNWLLAHGDQFCTGDEPYQAFRAMVRDEAWQHSFLKRPLAERRAIAAQLRANSREANSMKSEHIMDVTQDEIVRCMVQHGTSSLIHGHTHRPARHLVELPDGRAGERLVLGDWSDTFWVLHADVTGMSLIEHEVNEEAL